MKILFDRKTILNELYQYDLVNTKEDFSENTLKIIAELDEIDEIISESLFNFTIERLAFIDRAIIRMATYELKYTDTPEAIIINEAVLLTKEFSDLDDEKQHKFNNSVIDSINKQVRG